VFVPGKHLQPSLIFVSQAKILSLGRGTESWSTAWRRF